jgi:hypothetical protein
VKRIYISDRMTEERFLRYTLDVQSTLPTEADPYGFVVVGQSVEAVVPKEGAHVDQPATERRPR